MKNTLGEKSEFVDTFFIFVNNMVKIQKEGMTACCQHCLRINVLCVFRNKIIIMIIFLNSTQSRLAIATPKTLLIHSTLLLILDVFKNLCQTKCVLAEMADKNVLFFILCIENICHGWSDRHLHLCRKSQNRMIITLLIRCTYVWWSMQGDRKRVGIMENYR